MRARTIADGGARKALEALAVHEPDAYGYMDGGQQDLRRKLRAQAKQLGDKVNQTGGGAYNLGHFVEKLAYDQWHRLLFARFLLENNLLISPQHGVSVTLDDCEELALGLGLRDGWAVAARFAARELPEIFRADDPAGAVELPVEDRNQLIHLVMGLPAEVYTASDSLGWCYQFWQAERKREVNEAGVKIGADELPAVTQLFTEDYMVDFLLDNTLGAWHAGKVLAANPNLAESAECEVELRNAVALPECPWSYLRFIKAENGKWSPATGIFDAWPKSAKELNCLDPCMGSGHFVVAMFERLLALRLVEERSDEAAVVAAVIRDNLFGLEIDQRCTQIAAFNLALAAWRRVGHCKLPPMNLACSGLAPNTTESEWLAIAGDNEKMQNGMQRLHRLFKDAPFLGSLVNPQAAEGNLVEASYLELRPLLDKALAQEMKDDTTHEMAVMAQGLVKAAEILAGRFTLIATNVPYLKSRRQAASLKTYCEVAYPDSKADVATVFVERLLAQSAHLGTVALVTPQHWRFLGSYKSLRRKILGAKSIEILAPLGTGAFETIGGEMVNVMLLIASSKIPDAANSIMTLTAAGEETPTAKSFALQRNPIVPISQRGLLEGVDARLTFGTNGGEDLLQRFAVGLAGVQNGDSPKFQRMFWELLEFGADWHFEQSTVDQTRYYGGRQLVIFYDRVAGHLREDASIRRDKLHDSDQRGNQAWGKKGIVVSQMGNLPVTLYTGELYDQSCAVILPVSTDLIAAVWTFCSSGAFADVVRDIDESIKVTPNTLVKVPFDMSHWRRIAEEKHPQGLPEPFSSDPTQWLFDGNPQGSDQPLHVAAARLLGYRWPRQTGSSFLDCPALGADGLEVLASDDGIVCLSASKGEAPAAERLRRLLVQALGEFDFDTAIARAGLRGSRSSTLEDWLRDEFFEQHCALFDQRPFIWHIWDGHKNGFSALVNYHRLSHANLESLTYAYLGDWIRRQQAAVDAGEAGSDARMQAAKQLQTRLRLILEGEPPFDIFVRWKPLSKQAIGWYPDLNDGVRMNIRPFLAQDIPGGKKGAGIMRSRPNVDWEKHRGSESPREKCEFPWFWSWDGQTQDFAGVGTAPDGNRWNDCHYTNDFKRKARERAGRNE